MKTVLYYFSGTGNSLYVAKTLKSTIDKNAKLVKMDNNFNELKPNANTVGIIYPTYDFDAPKFVKEFVNKLRISSDTYLFLYTTSGGVYANSIHSVKKILENNKIEVSNSFATTFPDNSIVIKKSEEVNNEIIQDANNKLVKDCRDILNLKIDKIKKNQKYSFRNFIVGKGIEFIVKKYYQFGNINSNKNCTGCGVCTQVCPVNNISIKDEQAVFGSDCEMCLGCIHICSEKALRYKRMPEKENFQYRHPNISKKDLLLY